MTPTFALEIAPDTLTLSHRRFGAWHALGTVRRDDPRCPQRMDELRRTADWLEPISIRTAVVVASSQVMFLTVALPSNSRGNKRREIREALKTATPFPVEDIEFDFVSEDGGARVAIVAKSALAESEAIAVHFKLNPVRFAAHPSPRDFNGEPDFGPTGYAAHVQELQLKPTSRKKPPAQGGSRRSAPQQRAEAPPEPRTPKPAQLPPEAPQAPAKTARPTPAEPLRARSSLESIATPPLTFSSRRGPSVELRATRSDTPTMSATGRPSAPVEPKLTAAALATKAPAAKPKPAVGATKPAAAASKRPLDKVQSRFGVPSEAILDDLPPMAQLGARERGDARPQEARRQEARPQDSRPQGSRPQMGAGNQDARSRPPQSAAPRGPDPRAAQPRGPEARTPDHRGPESRGPDPRGPDPRGAEARGPDPRAAQSRGPAPQDHQDPRGQRSDPHDPRAQQAQQRGPSQARPPRQSEQAAVAHRGQGDQQRRPDPEQDTAGPTPRFDQGRRPQQQNAQSSQPRRAAQQPPQQPPRQPRQEAPAEFISRGRQPQDPGPSQQPQQAAQQGQPPAPQFQRSRQNDARGPAPAQAPYQQNPDAQSGDDRMAAAAASLTPDTNDDGKKRGGILGTRLARRQLSETEKMTVFGAREPGEDRRMPVLPIAAAIGALLLVAGGVWGAYYALVSSDDIAANSGDQPPSVELALAESAAGLPTRGGQAPEPRPASIAGLAPVDLGDGGTQVASTDPIAAVPAVDPIAAATAAAMAGPNPPPARPVDQATEKSEDIVIAAIDHRIPAEDAVAPPLARLLVEDTAPAPLATPAPFGTDYEFDENGFVVASKDGAVTPDGVIVFAGQPIKVPAPNPQIAAAIVGGAALAAVAVQTALEDDPQPRARPASLVVPAQDSTDAAAPADAEGATDTAATETEVAAVDTTDLESAVADTLDQVATDDTAADASTTPEAQFSATSIVPQARPASLVQRVAQARATVAASAPTAPAQPTQQTSASPAPAAAAPAPAIPTRASVARTATESDAITLSRLNLIGVYGSPSDRRALLRLPSGRYVKVKVGDRIDGGQVAQIGQGELQYVKDGRTVTLAMPRG